MSGEAVQIPAGDSGSVDGYLALPRVLPGPGLVLLGEHDADDAARQLAELFAAEGYVVLYPQAIRSDKELTAAIAALRNHSGCTG